MASNLHKKLPMPPIDDNALSKLKATLPKETAGLSSSYLDKEVCDIVYNGQYLKYPYDQIDSDDILDFAEKERKHCFLTNLHRLQKNKKSKLLRLVIDLEDIVHLPVVWMCGRDPRGILCACMHNHH